MPYPGCEACPFREGESQAANEAQNYTCLPTAGDNLHMFDRVGVSISCHENGKLCRGLLAERPAAKDRPVLTYERWYQSPDPVAAAQALASSLG